MRRLILNRTVLLIGFVVLVLALLMSFPLYNLANFNNHLDEFSSHIKNNDRDSAEKSFKQLKADYNYLTDLKLRYFADNYWFAETFLYESALAYLNEDCDLVEKLLHGHEDDYRAAYLSGLCKFRLFQAAYQAAKKDKDKTEIQERAKDRILPDFERCVKDGPGIEKNFNCSFDYDLVSNPESFKDALQNPRTGPKYILGIPKDNSQGPRVPRGPLNRRPGEGSGSNDQKRGG